METRTGNNPKIYERVEMKICQFFVGETAMGGTCPEVVGDIR